MYGLIKVMIEFNRTSNQSHFMSNRTFCSFSYDDINCVGVSSFNETYKVVLAPKMWVRKKFVPSFWLCKLNMKLNLAIIYDFLKFIKIWLFVTSKYQFYVDSKVLYKDDCNLNIFVELLSKNTKTLLIYIPPICHHSWVLVIQSIPLHVSKDWIINILTVNNGSRICSHSNFTKLRKM